MIRPSLRHTLTLLAAGLATAGVWAQEIQPDPLASHTAVYYLDSGWVENTGKAFAPVFSQDFTIDGATWLRLTFDDVTLAGTRAAGDESVLVITSLADGATQYMNARHVEQWQNTSAYFNGNKILVEIWAYPNTGPNHVSLTQVTAGLPPLPGNRSICGTTDDRVLSDDPRQGRLLPVGCTGWMIDDCNHCFLTAGHCTGNLQVVEFNVPLSNPNGTINHPGPEDQYPVDPASVQSNGGLGVGNDYAYFGTFRNSNTNLTPYEAQGDYYIIDDYIPPADSRPIRVTGYGSTQSGLAPLEWYLVQKTHTGPFAGLSGSYALQYRPDTTGGNSGSPVYDDNAGIAIGIHTHAGCTSSGGANQGTSLSHPGIQGYMANPQGVCAGAAMNFTFPNGIPTQVKADGTSTIDVIASSLDIDAVAGTGQLHIDRGFGVGFEVFPMADVSPNTYRATIPESDCSGTVLFFFSVEGDNGQRYYEPGGCTLPPAGAGYSALAADQIIEIASENFDGGNAGWTVGDPTDNATTGIWTRTDPEPTAAQPGDDHTPGAGGACWVTDGRAGSSLGEFDIDGGRTTLYSSVIDLSANPNARLGYWRWFSNNQGGAPGTDVMIVEINDGSGWAQVEQVGPTGPEAEGGWYYHEFSVIDVANPTATVQLRFIAADDGAGSIVEAAIDDFSIVEVTCGTTCPGDITGDGVVNVSDFAQLSACWGQACGDLNGDATTDFDDFAIFTSDWGCGL